MSAHERKADRSEVGHDRVQRFRARFFEKIQNRGRKPLDLQTVDPWCWDKCLVVRRLSRHARVLNFIDGNMKIRRGTEHPWINSKAMTMMGHKLSFNPKSQTHTEATLVYECIKRANS